MSSSKVLPVTNTSIEIKEAKKRTLELEKVAREQKQAQDCLTREIKFNELSKERGLKDYESWCDELGLVKLRDDVKLASQSTNHLLDKTQHALDVGKTHWSHAEEQHLRNFQNHSDLVDYVMKLFELFQDSAEQMYRNECDRLISEFLKEAAFRDSVYQHRKEFYGNYANAAVSLLKCRLSKNKEQFLDRIVEVESASVVQRGDYMEKAMEREAIAGFQIRNFMTVFNKSWPRERLDHYHVTLTKTSIDDEIIQDFGRQLEHSLKRIEKLNEELRDFSFQNLLRTAELKSEYQFMSKLRYECNDKMRKEELSDNERILYLVSVCEKTKKKLKIKLDKMKAIETTMKMCLKLEKLADRNFESYDEAFDDPVELFFKKLSGIEAECVLLRNYKKNLLSSNENLRTRIEQESHELGVRQNIAMLRLDTSPCVGTISQISHQIHQIKSSVILRNRFKLCKACNEHLA